jgi:8-oxo-dGTP diphosphatase
MSQSSSSRPLAVVVVVMRGDQTLVIRRGPEVSYSGYVGPLSGRLEPGESESAAVVREVYEEVGLKVSAIRRVWECLSEDRKYDLYWWLAEYSGGVMMLDAKEVSEAKWILPANFGALENTFADDRKFYSGVFPHLPEVS